MKQYVLGMLLLSFIMTGTAGEMGLQKDDCMSGSSCRWTIGGELSFLKPDGAMIDYATKMVFVTPAIVAASGNYVHASYEPSWSAFIKYDLAVQHTDVQFRTTHFDHEKGSSIVAPNALLVVNATLVSGTFFDEASGSVLFDLNNYELTVGAVINATQTGWRLRPYTGLHYVDENDRLIQRFYRVGGSFTHRLTSQFKGLGPVVGLESQYPLLDRLTLKNDVTLGFLVGQSDMRTVGDIDDAPVQPINFVDFQSFNRDRLVPYGFFDLGLLYRMPAVFRKYDAGISGGFKIIYYNDIHGRRAASSTNDPLRLNYVTYYGPYIGIQVRV
ncbi:Lpg1974 family pore-forming outer membrane protein [Legionella quateirensis]|uniref:Major outer membrane protein n=1 Tax=Legionella quateirensis TaxID=45072 RepID=A0A378L054_9GAMM|nr:Lpg1974 family pore-forming outer membrane protein [Legionella quateirensis]KTD52802.1 hypothetical protein Lqua_0635 [Legionella quateirensis]STY19221.1 Uncharacterised protein [Legionella quateirensis]